GPAVRRDQRGQAAGLSRDIARQMNSPVATLLRRHLIVWGFALLLPLPVLLGVSESGGIALVYLALGVALLAGEIFRPTGGAESPTTRQTKYIALAIGGSANAVVFSFLAILTEARS